MARFLIFLFPALADLILGTVFFVTTVRISESGGGPVAVALVLSIWAVVYMLTAQIGGRFITRRNSGKSVIAASLGMGLTSLVFILVPSLKAQYFIMALQGISTLFFFVSFQIFMREVEGKRPGGIVRSTSLYTFSWSMGFSIGPFISGNIWKFMGDWRWCYGVNIALALFTVAGIFMLKHHANEEHHLEIPEEETKKSENRIDYSKMPDLAWLGWTACGICMMAVMVIRSMFKVQAVEAGISRPDMGNTIAIMCFAQAITALCFIKSKYWIYKKFPIALFAFCGIAGLILFATSANVLSFYLAALFMGIYNGASYFYFVFHSIVHPEKSSRYVGINETVVGFTGIAGPLLGGFIADIFFLTAPYYLFAFLILTALMLQVTVYRKKISKELR